MRIISKKILREFWEQYPNAQEPIEAWYYETLKADWSSPQQIKNQFGNASFIADNRIIFNIKGNDYRLIVKINYPYRVVYIRFIGTHKYYDAIKASTI